MKEVPYSGRSENPLTRAAQDRDRALLPEPVQVLLRELFLRRDRHANDEAEIGVAIEEELVAGVAKVAVTGEFEETIRALTEERDRLEARAGVDANRIRSFESREAPGEEWKRGQVAARKAVLHRVRAYSWSDQSVIGDLGAAALTPYEPPRSEEVSRDVKPDNVQPTRLAPLTDRETRDATLVAASEVCDRIAKRAHEERFRNPQGDEHPSELAKLAREESTAMKCRDDILALRAIYLPKTPDVRREEPILREALKLREERDDAREKLRLATEQVEELATAHAAQIRALREAHNVAKLTYDVTHKGSGPPSDHDPDIYQLENVNSSGWWRFVHGVTRALAATEEYEAKRKERGWT